MKFKISLCILIIIIMCSSCKTIQSGPQDLMRPPKAIGNLAGVEDALHKYAGKDISLVYPKSGENRSAYFLKDIDGDHIEEVLAFYTLVSDQSTEINSLANHINVIKKVNNVWLSIYDKKVESSGIESIEFSDVTGDGIIEIIAGCNMYTTVEKQLIVYSFADNKLIERIRETYAIYTVADLNNDKINEVFLTTLDSVNKTSKAKLISLSGEGIIILGSTAMDGNITSYANIKASKIKNDLTGIYIDAYKGPNAMITELVFLKGTALVNPFYDVVRGKNEVTMRENTVTSMDIDNDGFIDIPQMLVLPGYEEKLAQDKSYLTVWLKFDGDYFKNNFTCMLNIADGYYFALQEYWVGEVTVQRFVDERKRIINKWDFMNSKISDEIITIQVFTQNDWEKGKLEGFSEITKKNNLVYAVKLGKNAGDYSITLEEVKAHFHFIKE